jgi:hypothetical protein
MVWRWLASVPLAMINAALASSMFCAIEASRLQSPPEVVISFVGAAVAGATFGIVIWGPALLLTLLFLGLPIRIAQRLATGGLDGEDRGDAVVGAACTVLGLVTLLLSGQMYAGILASAWTLRAGAILASLLGGAVVAAAVMRRAKRRALLRDVAQGVRCDYRVATTPGGRRLERVHADGTAYRVADVAEPVCELDEGGQCLQSLSSG